MASKMTIRELITVWGFDVNDKPLRNLDKKIQKLKKNTRSAGQVFHSMGSEIRQSLRESGSFDNLSRQLRGLKGTAIAVGSVIAASAAKIGFVLNEAGKMEQTKLSFEVLLGSAKEAKIRLTELFDLAKKTPFTIPDVLSNAKLLLAYGIEATKLRGTMEALGNIASAVGTHALPRLALALGQVKAATKLRGQELRQFTEAGVDLLKALSLTLGKKVGQVQEMVSKGKISFELVEKAINNLTSGSGRFANLMVRQSKTLFGVISNIKDVIILLSAEIGESLLPTAKEIANEFLYFLDVNKELIKTKAIQYMKILAKFTKDVFNILKLTVGILKPFIYLLGGAERAVKLLTLALAGFLAVKLASILGTIVIGIGQFIAAINIATASVLALDAAIALIPTLIGLAVVAIGLIVEDIVAFFQGRDSVTGRIINAFNRMVPKIKSVFSAMLDAIMESTSAFIQKWIGLFQSNYPALFGFLKAISKLFFAVFKLIAISVSEPIIQIANLLSRIPEGLMILFGTISSFIKNHLSTIKAIFQTFGDILLSPFVDLKNFLIGLFKITQAFLKSGIFSKFIAIPTAIINSFSRILNAFTLGDKDLFTKTLQNEWTLFIQSILNFPSVLKHTIQSALNTISFSSISDILTTAFSKGLSNLLSDIISFGNRASSILKKIATPLSLSHLIKGLRTGLKSIPQLIQQSLKLNLPVLSYPLGKLVISYLLPLIEKSLSEIWVNITAIIRYAVALTKSIPQILDKTLKKVQSMFSNISLPTTALKTLIDQVTHILSTVKYALVEVWTTLMSIAQKTILFTKTTIDTISNLLQKVISTFSDIKLPDIAGSLLKAFQGVIGLIENQFITSIQNVIDFIQSAFESVKENILSMLSAPLSGIETLIEKAKVLQGVLNIGSPIKGFLHSIQDKIHNALPIIQPMASLIPTNAPTLEHGLGITGSPSTSHISHNNNTHNIEVKAPITVHVPEGTPSELVGMKIQDGINSAIKDLLRTTLRANEPQVLY